MLFSLIVKLARGRMRQSGARLPQLPEFKTMPVRWLARYFLVDIDVWEEREFSLLKISIESYYHVDMKKTVLFLF